MTRSPSVNRLPEGQEQTVRALARAMFRNATVAALVVGIGAVAVAGVMIGTAGATSATIGGALAYASSLLTLFLMWRTAALAPQAVMVASLGGFLLKAILLLVTLFLFGAIPGVHRESLAIGMLVVLIAATAAEGAAGHRLRTLIVDPTVVPDTAATSSPLSGMSDPTAAGPDRADGAVDGGAVRPDREK